MQEPEVHQITDAGVSLSEDQVGRTRKYLWSMGLRTVCFVGAVVTPSPWRWILVAAALFLPYLAVVVANAGRERSDDQSVSFVEVRHDHKVLDRGR
jgi:Flp pilus assembly protein TadB